MEKSGYGGKFSVSYEDGTLMARKYNSNSIHDWIIIDEILNVEDPVNPKDDPYGEEDWYEII